MPPQIRWPLGTTWEHHHFDGSLTVTVQPVRAFPAMSPALSLLEQEARALLTRLEKVKPFALHQTMVPAAALPPAVLSAIDRYLIAGRRKVRLMVQNYVDWLVSRAGRSIPLEPAHR